MNLVIDIGNSVHKLAVFSDHDEILRVEKFGRLTTNVLRQIISEYPIQYSILSSVGKHDDEIEDYLRSQTRFIPFSHQTKFPIKLRYETPETLGLDRIANAVAATVLFPDTPVLSIQAGTCLVLDFITQDGEYWGGSISPGIEMRFKALHQFTHRLPLLEKNNPGSFIGTSTRTSIESGVMNGVVYEIKGFIERYKKQFPDLKVILTGGDLFFLEKPLKNTIFADSNSVLTGLNKILKINAEDDT